MIFPWSPESIKARADAKARFIQTEEGMRALRRQQEFIDWIAWKVTLLIAIAMVCATIIVVHR